MSVEEVGVGATAAATVRSLVLIGRDVREQLLVDVIGLLGLVQAGPEVDAPARAPACRLVALDLQRSLCCFLEGGIRQVVAGVESYQVALMTVLEVPVVPVVVPLVDVAHVPDGVGVQAGERLLVGG